MLTFDLVMVGFLVLGFVFGWRKGLLRILSGLIGLVLEIYVAIHFNSRMSETLDNFLGFTDKMTVFLSEHIPVAKLASTFPLNLFWSKLGADQADGFAAAPAHYLSGLLLFGLSFLLLFFLTKLLFNLIGSILTAGLDHTLIGPLNRFLGGVTGVFFAGLIIGISVMGLSFILGPAAPDADGFLNDIAGILDKSRITSYLPQLFK